MRAGDLSKALSAESFRPFDLNLSNGETYQVTHPEQVMVDRSVAMIGTRRLDEARRYEKLVICSLLHILRVVPVEEREVP